jgi:thiosulfate dehydrogenase
MFLRIYVVEGKMKFFVLAMVLISSLILVFGENQKSNAEGLGYKQANIKNGALLYDNWPEIKKADIKDTHPLYPAASKKSGKSTWRCKECHGWDYIGKDGRYSKGSHYTGISGVYGERTEDPKELFNELSDKDEKHDFSEYLSHGEIWDLVKFIREGQIDIRTVLDEHGKAKGDSANGKALYNTNCAACHGDEGNEIDFKYKKEGLQGVGWLANDNPQETIHKIRWGHPGSDMPSVIVDAKLADQDAVDILTYSQSLDN